MNLARLDGKRFYTSFFADYVKNYNKKYAAKIQGAYEYSVSLILELNKTKDLPMFTINKSLCEASVVFPPEKLIKKM